MTQTFLVGGSVGLLGAGAGLIYALDRLLVRRSTPRYMQQLQAWRDDTSDPELKITPMPLPPLQPLKARRLTRMELLARREG